MALKKKIYLAPDHEFKSVVLTTNYLKDTIPTSNRGALQNIIPTSDEFLNLIVWLESFGLGVVV